MGLCPPLLPGDRDMMDDARVHGLAPDAGGRRGLQWCVRVSTSMSYLTSLIRLRREVRGLRICLALAKPRHLAARAMACEPAVFRGFDAAATLKQALHGRRLRGRHGLPRLRRRGHIGAGRPTRACGSDAAASFRLQPDRATPSVTVVIEWMCSKQHRPKSLDTRRQTRTSCPLAAALHAVPEFASGSRREFGVPPLLRPAKHCSCTVRIVTRLSLPGDCDMMG